jgi:hypothetical protein
MTKARHYFRVRAADEAGCTSARFARLKLSLVNVNLANQYCRPGPLSGLPMMA